MTNKMTEATQILGIKKPEFMLLFNNKSYNQIFDMVKNTEIVLLIKAALKENDA